MKRLDLIGLKFGKLTVIKKLNIRKGKKVMWLCECECGRKCEVATSNLTGEKQKSCGCVKKVGNPTHGLYYTRQHRIWALMKDRCYNEKSPNYKYYGGRGIKVCEEWKNSFSTFYEWAMNNGYADNLSIDRIDVNNDYCPENCRWATSTEQNNNTRKNKRIVYDSESHTLSEWAIIKNIPVSTLWSRLYRYGWSTKKSLGGG